MTGSGFHGIGAAKFNRLIGVPKRLDAMPRLNAAQQHAVTATRSTQPVTTGFYIRRDAITELAWILIARLV